MEKKTWIQEEQYAYPNGGQTRRGAALFSDGKIRRVWGGIPDTMFSIPAHTRVNKKYVHGFLYYNTEDNLLRFHTYGDSPFVNMIVLP